MSHSPKNAVITDKKQMAWRIFKRKKMVLNGCMLGLTMLAQAANAGPEGGVVTVGQGTIAQVGSATNINQASDRLDINWRTFSTGVSESVNFAQPSTSAVAINRVIGGVPSELRGALNANGRVFILNDSGITFHGTSRVNVGALVATTAKDVTVNGDKYSFTGTNGLTSVINKGDITVSQGGFAVLAAPNVENSGVVLADLGKIVLASTTAYTLDLRGDNLITYTIPEESLSKVGVKNTGKLQAKSGTIEISAKAAKDAVNSVINLAGVVDADSFGKDKNGGTVLVAGKADLINTASISANGGVNGNGGKVITKVSGLNNFTKDASVTIKGGVEAGDGGFLDISGSSFIVAGKLDAAAPNGVAGTILFDPAKITIKNGAGIATIDTLFEEALEALSVGGTNVLVEAEDEIFMEDLADNQLTGGAGDIKLRATRNNSKIIFEDKNDSIFTTTGDILVRAGSGGIDIGSLITQAEGKNPGNIELISVSGGDIKAENLSITKNNVGADNSTFSRIDIKSRGDITLENLIIDIATGTKNDGVSRAKATADLEADGDITITGETRVKTVATHTEGKVEADSKLLLKANTKNSEGGNVTLGTVSITADASGTAPINYSRRRGYFAGQLNSFADALIDITADKNVTLNNQFTVFSKAQTFADSHTDTVVGTIYGEGSARANADFDINAEDVVGRYLTVVSTALNAGVTESEAEEYATLADTNVNFITDRSLEVGDLIIRATAVGEHSGDISANSYFGATVGRDASFDALIMSADADNNGKNPLNTEANVEFIISAGNAEDETISGIPETVTGTGEDTILVPATPDTIISGGSITLDRLGLSALAEANGGDVDAAVSGNLSAANDITMTHLTALSARAFNSGDLTAAMTIPGVMGEDTVSPGALLVDPFTGETTDTSVVVPGVMSEDTIVPAHYGYASADAESSLNIHAGKDVSTRYLDVSSEATTRGKGHTEADSSILITAFSDVTITGETKVFSTAYNYESGISEEEVEEYVSAESDLEITAGFWKDKLGDPAEQEEESAEVRTGNLSITGDVTVDAAASGFTDNVSALVDADLYALNDVTITGNVAAGAIATGEVVAEEAESEIEAQFEYESDVFAKANLSIIAGDTNSGKEKGRRRGGEGSGDLTITGNVNVTAKATGINLNASSDIDVDLYAYESEEAEAEQGNILITGDITLDSTAITSGTAQGAFAEGYFTGAADGDFTADAILAKAFADNNSARSDDTTARMNIQLSAGNGPTKQGAVITPETTIPGVLGEDTIIPGTPAQTIPGIRTPDILIPGTPPISIPNGNGGVTIIPGAPATTIPGVQMPDTIIAATPDTIVPGVLGADTIVPAVYAADVEATGSITVNKDLTLSSKTESNGGYASANTYGSAYAKNDVTLKGKTDVSATSTNAGDFRAEETIPAGKYDDTIIPAYSDPDTIIPGEEIFDSEGNSVGFEPDDLIPGTFYPEQTLVGADYPEEIIPAHYDFASASANSNFNVNADKGNALLEGTLDITADASTKGVGGTSARANGDVTAGNDVTLNGDVTVSADADNEEGGFTDRLIKGSSVTADASFGAVAGNGYSTREGNLTLKNLTVEADASGYTDNVNADAEVELYALNDITVDGDITVDADAYGYAETGEYEGGDFGMYGFGKSESGVTADADLTIYAGKSGYYGYFGAGTFDLTGDITVKADAEGYNLDANANADADITATNDALITGDITVDADAEYEIGGIGWLGRGGNAYASADLDIAAGKHGYFGGGYYGYYGAGNLDLTGDITVTADATSEGNFASANAGGDLEAANDVLITGDTDVIATTNVVRESAVPILTDGEGSIPVMVFPRNVGYETTVSNLFVKAGRNRNALDSDLAITGDVTVASNGLSDAGGENIAFADLRATDDVTVNGDVSVLAINPSAISRNSADASLIVVAGNRSGDGKVTITGNVEARAEASAAPEFFEIFDVMLGDVGDDSVPSVHADARATSLIALQADNDVLITGDITSEADATVNTGELAGGRATATSNIDIDAGNAGFFTEGGEGSPSTVAYFGNVNITGNIESDAQTAGNATYQYAYGKTSAVAPDDLIITGNDPIARARTTFVQQKFSGIDLIGNNSIGGTYAELELRAGKNLIVQAPAVPSGSGGGGGSGGAGGGSTSGGTDGGSTSGGTGGGSTSGGTGGGSTSGGGSTNNNDLNQARQISTNQNFVPDNTGGTETTETPDADLGSLEPAAGGGNFGEEGDNGFCQTVNAAGGGALSASCGSANNGSEI